MIRIDCRAGLRDVFEHRIVIAMNEVRQIGTNSAAFAVYGMAFGAHDLFAKVDASSIQPTPSRKLRNGAFCFRRLAILARLGPRQKNPPEGKRSQPLILSREPSHFQSHLATRIAFCLLTLRTARFPLSSFGGEGRGEEAPISPRVDDLYFSLHGHPPVRLGGNGQPKLAGTDPLERGHRRYNLDGR